MITWVCKSFDDLKPLELYKIHHARNQVFVVEQQCAYQDCDNKDQQCYHLVAWDANHVAAYTRLLPPGLAFNNMSIGRVLTAEDYRGTGLGREVMTRSIAELYRLYGTQPITIGAQLYLQKFYESLGFSQISDVYLEDNIKHIEMLHL